MQPDGADLLCTVVEGIDMHGMLAKISSARSSVHQATHSRQQDYSHPGKTLLSTTKRVFNMTHSGHKHCQLTQDNLQTVEKVNEDGEEETTTKVTHGMTLDKMWE